MGNLSTSSKVNPPAALYPGTKYSSINYNNANNRRKGSISNLQNTTSLNKSVSLNNPVKSSYQTSEPHNQSMVLGASQGLAG
jgi:non-homologous end joining protein Ku